MENDLPIKSPDSPDTMVIVPLKDVDDDKSMKAMLLGALGIVYGDIGISPLYTLREIFVQGDIQPDRGVGPGSVLTHILDHHSGRDGQVRHLRAARRQQGRGRHSGTDLPGSAPPAEGSRLPDPADPRHHRGSSVEGRRHRRTQDCRV
jgi:hypothetical protein